VYVWRKQKNEAFAGSYNAKKKTNRTRSVCFLFLSAIVFLNEVTTKKGGENDNNNNKNCAYTSSKPQNTTPPVKRKKEEGHNKKKIETCEDDRAFLFLYSKRVFFFVSVCMCVCLSKKISSPPSSTPY